MKLRDLQALGHNHKPDSARSRLRKYSSRVTTQAGHNAKSPLYGLWAKRIRELRVKAGLLQIDLANAMGVTPTTITHWEIGRAVPHTTVLPLLASTLKTDIGGLFP